MISSGRPPTTSPEETLRFAAKLKLYYAPRTRAARILRVPRFFPAARPRYGDPARFRFSQYRRNREYQALAAYSAVMAVLVVKLIAAAS